jgi:drug/metabolite transporter (DMT)-like permease
VAILTGASLLGFAAIFVKWCLVGGTGVLAIGFYRMAFALPGILLLAQREGGPGAGVGRRWAAAAGVAFFLDLALWQEAMVHTGAANATLIVGGLSPIWVALYSALFLRLRYGWIGWAGQALGLCGALILALAKGARVGSGKGEAIAVLASFCYAAFTLLLGRARRDLKAPQALLWMSLGCLICFGLAMVAFGHAFQGFTPRAWASLVGLGLVVQLLAWWLNTWGLGHVDAALGAIGLQAQQVATIFLAAWMLHEPLKPLGVLGAVAIVGGILMVALSPKRVRQ